MKATEEQAYKCEVCGKVGTETEITRHEQECRKQRDERGRQVAEYQRKTRERIRKAVSWAESSEPVVLLVAHGFKDEARTVCREWARWNLWDCGTSSGWEEVYGAMIAAAFGKANMALTNSEANGEITCER